MSGLIEKLRANHPSNSGRLEEIQAASLAEWTKKAGPIETWNQTTSAGLVSGASGSDASKVEPWVEQSAFRKCGDFNFGSWTDRN
jgi:hypothetical protein